MIIETERLTATFIAIGEYVYNINGFTTSYEDGRHVSITPFHKFEITDYDTTTIGENGIQTVILNWFELTSEDGDYVEKFTTEWAVNFVIDRSEPVEIEDSDVDPVVADVAESLTKQAHFSKVGTIKNNSR